LDIRLKPDGWVFRFDLFLYKFKTIEDCMRLTLRTSLLAFALVASCVATASAASIVTNGDFQTGTFAGWTINPSSSFPWAIGSSGPNFYASTGCVGAQCITGTMAEQAYLYQDLSTVAGTTYALSFDYNPSAGTPTELEVLFGSTVVADLVDVPNTTLTYTYSVLATGSTTRLEFLGRQDPGFDFLDNVSATGAAGITPEPSTFVLVGSSMLGLAGAVKRRFARS
jgi:hypothetical protein